MNTKWSLHIINVSYFGRILQTLNVPLHAHLPNSLQKSSQRGRSDMRRRKLNKKNSFSQTAEEYAGHSSIHGIGYVFDRQLGFLDRLLWLLVTVAFLGLAIALTWNTWTQWRGEQVVNDVKCGNTKNNKDNFYIFFNLIVIILSKPII